MATMVKGTSAADLQLADALAGVAERLTVGTVQVRGRGDGAGSGVIWRADGLIVTNAHVVRGPRAHVTLSDGRAFDGEVMRVDARLDLAAIRIPAMHLPAVAVGDSDAIRVGELVVALGHPWGVRNSLATGVIHAAAARGARGSGRWVQADLRLAPGNSGGPLADARGRVIGINSMIVRGLALAVPSNVIARFLDAAAVRPSLGVTARPVALRVGAGTTLGLLVLDVAAGSSAHDGGIAIGDVLVGANGRPFTQPDALSELMQAASPEAMLTLDVVRGGAPITLSVTLRANGRAGAAAA